MQVFGIEVRKANSIKNLYQDIDTVISSIDINEVKISAVAHSLQKMLRSDSYFSMCTIDKCIKVSQIAIDQERYDIYSSQHCVQWTEMTPEFRQQLIAMVLDDFREVLCSIDT